MTKIEVTFNDTPERQSFSTLNHAKTAAREHNKAHPYDIVRIFENAKLREIWVGNCTLIATGKDQFLIFSDADFDSIGATQLQDDRWVVMARGALIASTEGLASAAAVAHEHALAETAA